MYSNPVSTHIHHIPFGKVMNIVGAFVGFCFILHFVPYTLIRSVYMPFVYGESRMFMNQNNL